MDNLNEQIPRLQFYIKLLEKEYPTKNIKEELIFQKKRLNTMMNLVKPK